MVTLYVAPNPAYIFQVCFKHPDLLKQAREACVARRTELESVAKSNSRRKGSQRTTAVGGGGGYNNAIVVGSGGYTQVGKSELFGICK